MLYRAIIAVCSQIDTEHINTLCGQDVEWLNVKPCGTYSDKWALEENSISSYIIMYPLRRIKVLFETLIGRP